MPDESVKCRGLNGSIRIFPDKLIVKRIGLRSVAVEIKFADVSSVVVERKSMIPFMTLTILTTVALLVVRFNLLWFVLSLYSVQILIIPIAPLIALAIAMFCVIPTLARSVFVNVLVRSKVGTSTLYLVPIRSAKMLARKFSEISLGS